MNKPGGKQTAPHVFRSSLSLCVGKQDGKCYLSILNDCWKTGGRRRARRQTAGWGGWSWRVAGSGGGDPSPTMSDALRFFCGSPATAGLKGREPHLLFLFSAKLTLASPQRSSQFLV